MLCTRRDAFPLGVSYEQHMQWYDQITWVDLIALFRSHNLSSVETVALATFERTARDHAALAPDRSQTKSALIAPTRHDYGGVFALLKAQDPHRRAVACYGGGISPVLFLGRDDWAKPLGSHSVERIAVFYNLTKYGSPECYAFQVWLWDDNFFPRTEIQPDIRAGQLMKMAVAINGSWEIGKRSGKGRCIGTPHDALPADAGQRLVGVVTFESLFVKPPYRPTPDLVTCLNDRVLLLERTLAEALARESPTRIAP